MAKRTCLGLLAASLISQQAFAADDVVRLSSLGRALAVPQNVVAVSAAPSDVTAAHHDKRADFELEIASRDARHVADWVVDSGDNRGMPFAVIDKMDAKVFVFDADGRLRGAAPALLGLAHGDDTVPGLGDRKLSDIRPDERTTPAGRFVAALGRNIRGEEILWVDYESALSLHPVIVGKVKDHRAQRLATPTPLDNRISFGCINVPRDFYEDIVSKIFAGTNGIVYILPETRSPGKVFTSYDAYERIRLLAESQR